MRVTVLSLCLVMSAICTVCAQQMGAAAFCPLRMREKIRILQCTVNNLQERDRERVFQVMTYNRLDAKRLAKWLCTPDAAFALPKVFKRKQLKRFIAAGISCQNILMGNAYGGPSSYE
ncbi:uncharacterized protein LOC119436221 [Dermacentor silvarum]|uniref:uncharacterized protein LOC119436221 n=1 Tax=Dermacentor silvarum TaxID=543639 RepID=UPI0018986E7F|nr:uncharacterized protein LOC119436221 [Dermacentor silvarum]